MMGQTLVLGELMLGGCSFLEARSQDGWLAYGEGWERGVVFSGAY
jgi:hypothetical protein